MTFLKKEKNHLKADNKLTISALRQKGAAFCAYRERTLQEARNKLYDLGAYSSEVEETISWLITENFINEERYAQAYAGGKFRIKQWGRVKILQGLKRNGLSPYCIDQGMKVIEEEEYRRTLEALIEKKSRQEKETDVFKRKNKIARYAIAKGYEAELVWEILKN